MTAKKASRPKLPKTRETSGPASELILYQTEDGRTRIECRFEDETIWLSQALMADLFQTSVQNVNLHILNILADGEAGEATIKDYLIVRTESGREVRRTVKHYNLDIILAVGYRVRSDRGIAFRQWATARLSEYLVKGFLLDDERLKNPDPSRPDYFDDVLERIQDIRSAEKRMYLKAKDIFVLARGVVGSRSQAPRDSADAATKALIVPSHAPARRSFFNERSGAGRSARPKEACSPLRSGTRLGLRTRGSRARDDRATSAPPLLRTTVTQPLHAAESAPALHRKPQSSLFD
jgi:hypothetical protein